MHRLAALNLPPGTLPRQGHFVISLDWQRGVGSKRFLGIEWALYDKSNAE